MTADSFPRLAARTMNFQLGLPRGFVVSPDGNRVVFLRADNGTSRTHALWVYDVASGEERKVADPASAAQRRRRAADPGGARAA